jgi:enoyl-CoA hydratase
MIETNIESDIAIVRMKHGKVNAMDLKFCKQLTANLLEIENSSTRAVVLTGNDRVFSAGVDLRAVLEGGESYRHQFLPALVECFKTIFRFSKPIIAAINSHAVAGGCVIATACDKRLIHAKARIGIPELRVGVPLPAIAIEIMRFGVSHEALQSMVNAGQNYRGEEALRVGLVDSIVESQELLSLAIAEANSLLAIPPSVFAVTKRQLRGPAWANVEINEAANESRVFEIWDSEEIQDVIRKFVDSRL